MTASLLDVTRITTVSPTSSSWAALGAMLKVFAALAMDQEIALAEASPPGH